MTDQSVPNGVQASNSVAKPMTTERLRRQVFTVGVWARKHKQPVLEEWANQSVEFIAVHSQAVAAKVSRLRADLAAVEAEKTSLLAELQMERKYHTVEMDD
jgi:hypothetical protein